MAEPRIRLGGSQRLGPSPVRRRRVKRRAPDPIAASLPRRMWEQHDALARHLAEGTAWLREALVVAEEERWCVQHQWGVTHEGRYVCKICLTVWEEPLAPVLGRAGWILAGLALLLVLVVIWHGR